MVAWIIVYFLLVVSTLAVCFLPPVRQRTRLLWRHWRSSSGQWADATRQRGHRQARSLQDTLGFHTGGASRWTRQHWRWVGSGVALLVGLPLLALSLRGWQDIGGFDHRQAHATNEQIAALLEGEQLVPPAALPPEMFTTQEVEMLRPMIRYASREWVLLDEDFRQRLLVVFKIMKETHGYDMVLLEGYRSPERQARLAALGGQVTQADAFRSYHQYGLASDCAFLRNGKIVISERDPWAMKGYELYGQVARSVGLTWGGTWRTLKDYGHTELRRPGVLGRTETQPNETPVLPDFSGDFNADH
ncbi:MAG TPA: M15 family metallopeptidase [Candidatus Aquabacterium excrementipullorum]|nr:M15 family metallopeptidase [Candidatus Aquabacterium excrementipullorum]